VAEEQAWSKKRSSKLSLALTIAEVAIIRSSKYLQGCAVIIEQFFIR
jgi:hypothetical protein